MKAIKDRKRDQKIYSYVPEDIKNWILKSCKKHNVSEASFVYANLQRTFVKEKDFDPNTYLPNKFESK